MYQYYKRMYKSCPGCYLSNTTQNCCADLVYSFPIDTPMQFLFFDIYASGTEINFDGTKHYLIGACDMTYFGIYKPTAEQNASAFASALMNIWLRFWFPTQLWLKMTANFLEFLLILLHSLTPTFMFYPVKIMIQWLLSASDDFSTLVSLFLQRERQQSRCFGRYFDFSVCMEFCACCWHWHIL